VFALYSHVLFAEVFTIVPHSMLCVLEMGRELTAVPLTPELNRAIGLVALDHDPPSPIIAAAWATTQKLNLGALFDAAMSR